MRPRQNADGIFKFTFLNKNVCISNKMPLKFVPKGSINKYNCIGLDIALVPTRRQAIIWANDG